MTAETVLGKLEDGQDQAGNIALDLGVPIAVVRARLLELQKSGRAERTGARRATRWHATATATPQQENGNPKPSQRSAATAGSSSGNRQSSQRGSSSGNRRSSQRPQSRSVATKRSPSDDSSTEVSAEVVLGALREGRTKPADIANHLGVPERVVRQRLRELEEAGRIRRRRR